MILECRICDKLFSHPVELRKHNIRKHEEFETREDLNKTISSVQELKLRHLVFPVKKRKSIFEGVDVGEFKKRKAEESIEVSKQNQHSENVKKFILTFDCKKCTLSFTKYGLFKTHTESHEEIQGWEGGQEVEPKNVVDNNVIVKSVSEPFKTPKSTKTVKVTKTFKKYSCEDCSERYDVHHDFRKPFSMKLQTKLLSQMPFHFSQYPGFVRIHSNFPGIRPRSVARMGNDEFIVGELKGEGGFAKVWAGYNIMHFNKFCSFFRCILLLGVMAQKVRLTQC